MIPRGLIVSCQARADDPLHGPWFMAAMARAAAEAGAVAVRANGAADVAAVRAALDGTGLPVIGLNKVFGTPVYITPDRSAATAVALADIVALDATDRPRPEPLAGLIAHVREVLGRPVFADVATFDEGLAAADMGAAYVATTLSGYTDGPPDRAAPPDLALVERLAVRLSVPVIAEGRYDTPERARAALDAGAHAVVVGTMITNPREIARRFVRALG